MVLIARVSVRLQYYEGDYCVAFIAQAYPETADASLFANLLSHTRHTQQRFAQLIVLQIEILEQDTISLSPVPSALTEASLTANRLARNRSGIA